MKNKIKAKKKPLKKINIKFFSLKFMNSAIRCFIICLILRVLASQTCYPNAVHISLGDYYAKFEEPTPPSLYEYMKIMFYSNASCSNAYVVFQDTVNASITIKITEQQNSKLEITDNSQGYLNVYAQYILTFKLATNFTLEAGRQFNYTIYPNENSASVNRSFYFILPDKSVDAKPRVIITGMMDISNESIHSRAVLNYLAYNNSNEKIDAIIYTGDMAFNLDDNLYAKGNDFFKSIESFAAYIPFMPTAGIRDDANDYFYYSSMIGMPLEDTYDDDYSCFNLGPVHFVEVNLAYYFEHDDDYSEDIYSWLEADLKIANSKANRMSHPWIIVYGYRSFYCSNSTDPYCGTHTGSASKTSQIEDLFHKYKVDLYISASNLPVYERLKPIYQNEIYEFSSLISPDSDYIYMVNPQATVYFVDAAAGNNLFFDLNSSLFENSIKTYEKGYYSLRATPFQGLGEINVNSKTQMSIKQISTYDGNPGLLDNCTLINTLQKWSDDWPFEDKVTFIASFLVFVIVGSIILIVFMLSME